MKKFQWFYDKAVQLKGDEKAVKGSLPTVKTTRQLIAISDDRYLSDMSRRIFRAGLKHSMVDGKWPEFEKAFYDFNPQRINRISDETLEKCMNNKKIIRHWGKIKTVRHNARFILDIAESHESFGKFIAQWPDDNIIDLWQLLKKRGSHLGGNSGPAFLRMVGKDTFLLSKDVVGALVAQGLISKIPTTKRDLQTVQNAFNDLAQQSGWPLSHVSRLLSMTIN